MYKECKTLRSCERQREFGKMLLKIMEKQDLKKITVSALCREMKVPRRSFYRYFDTIEDVLDALTDEVVIAASFRVDRQIDLEAFFEYWKNHEAGRL